MPILNDRWIRKMSQEHGMIEPFESGQVRDGVISYGVSSYGYDIRVAPEFKVFTNVFNVVVDPKEFDPRSFVDVNEKTCIIPPNSFALARTLEYFRIPRNVLVVCVGKSTYARCGIIVNVTPLEPPGRGTSPSRSRIRLPCRPRSTAAKGSLSCCFSRGTRSPKPRTPTERESTRTRRELLCPECDPGRALYCCVKSMTVIS
jgi:dCTP deaminase